MENLAETKVSKIVAKNYKTAKVFSSYGIDFCCNGGIPLSQACEENGADLDLVLQQLEIELSSEDKDDVKNYSMPDLVDHIEKNHHDYIRKTAPLLQAYLDKLCRVHGDRHPELFEIKSIFDVSTESMLSHMNKEESVLFPFIKEMVAGKEANKAFETPHFGHIDNPIAMMEDEHTEEGDRFREISRLTNSYKAPADGCQTYRVAFSILEEYEQDLHRHIHLENNILFIKAKQLFQEMTAGSPA